MHAAHCDCVYSWGCPANTLEGTSSCHKKSSEDKDRLSSQFTRLTSPVKRHDSPAAFCLRGMLATTLLTIRGAKVLYVCHRLKRVNLEALPSPRRSRPQQQQHFQMHLAFRGEGHLPGLQRLFGKDGRGLSLFVFRAAQPSTCDKTSDPIRFMHHMKPHRQMDRCKAAV